jgi:signal transduction histidine kinase
METSLATRQESASSDFSAALQSAKLQALYHFAYGLSHEINNPLANIATRAQALLVDERDSDRRRKLATIVQQAFRAHEMIADLMLFARPPALKPQPTDLVKLSETVVSELQGQAREQATRLVYSGESGPLVATADPTHLAVALKALVQNSLEAVVKGGEVHVNVECGVRNAELQQESRISSSNFHFDAAQSVPPPNLQSAIRNPQPEPTPHSAFRNPHFLLSVTDTGPGIPSEVLPHIFDPFFSGREAGRGLGLGLSKAWRIIKLHGGDIEVDAQPGACKVTIALPCGDEPKEFPAGALSPKRQAAGSEPSNAP